MRVGVVGINHKLAQLKLREQLAKACQKWFGSLQVIHDDHCFILLSTCNRTEVYFSSEDLAVCHTYLLNILRSEVKEDFDHKLYSYFGIDCFSHLTRVTLGLDSAIIAETEIQGQVKAAYETVLNNHLIPKELHFLFQKSLGISKKLRSELQLGRGMPNLEHAILQLGKKMFEHPETVPILLVGASDINKKILSFLKEKRFQNITLCNRSEIQAQLLAKQQNVSHLPWQELGCWHKFEWIIFGTKSADYLVKHEEVTSLSTLHHKLILDLSVPRNVEPTIGSDPRITLLNIDQINQLLHMRSQKMAHTLREAEKKVVQITEEHTTRYLTKEQSKIQCLAFTG